MAISKAFKAFLSSIHQSGNGDCYLVTDFFADVHGTTRMYPIRSGYTSYTFHPGPSTMEKITLPLPVWAQQVCKEGPTAPSFKELNAFIDRIDAGVERNREWHDSQVSDCDLRPAE